MLISVSLSSSSRPPLLREPPPEEPPPPEPAGSMVHSAEQKSPSSLLPSSHSSLNEVCKIPSPQYGPNWQDGVHCLPAIVSLYSPVSPGTSHSSPPSTMEFPQMLMVSVVVETLGWANVGCGRASVQRSTASRPTVSRFPKLRTIMANPRLTSRVYEVEDQDNDRKDR